MKGSDTPPKYNVAIVEAVILEVAAELHPEHLRAEELSLEIVGDARDGRELKTAAQAIDGLREFGLVKVQDDGVVELTPVAIHVVALLT